jgi:hypothetical protein
VERRDRIPVLGRLRVARVAVLNKVGGEDRVAILTQDVKRAVKRPTFSVSTRVLALNRRTSIEQTHVFRSG